MPNWCSNRMYFSGEPAQIAEIKRLAAVQLHRFIAAPQMKIFSCFWPEVPDFCRPLKMCGLNHAPD